MGVCPGRSPIAARGSLASGRTSGENGSMRDGQLPAVIELKHQDIRQDRQDSRYSHVALGALQGDFVPRAGLHVKTRGHDPPSAARGTPRPQAPSFGRSLCVALTLPREPLGCYALLGPIMPGENPLMLWTYLAVIAALLGTGVVAWQAMETHRTTTLSQQTLEASNALAIDSARTRLDQNAPRVEVYVEQVSVLSAGSGNVPGPQAESGSRWHLPADADRTLQVQAQVRVVNLMTDRTIHLKVSGLHDTAMRPDTEVLLVPAAKLAYFLTATFTLGQWAENWEARRAGDPPPNCVEGYVTAGT